MHVMYVNKIKIIFMIIKIYFDIMFSEGRFRIFPCKIASGLCIAQD